MADQISSQARPARDRPDLAVRRLKRHLSQVGDQVELFRALYRACSEVVDTTIFFLGVYDEAAESVQVVRQMASGVELDGGAFALGTGFTSDVIRTRQPLLIRDWSHGPHVQVQYATDYSGLPRSSVTVPLVFAGRAVAVLSAQSYEVAAYDSDDVRLLQQMSDVAAATIARLYGGRTEFDAILANMADALLVLDSEGRILRLNHAARTLLGLEKSSIVLGQTIDRDHLWRAPADARELVEMLIPIIEALRRGESRQDLDVEMHTRRRVFNFTGTPLRDIGGGLSGGVLVFRDVTSRREVERLKHELVSIASHDIQTPLGVIKGQAQILRRSVRSGALSPEEVETAVGMIIGQADRLSKLLGRLLDFSRLEAGRLELQLRPVDLPTLVKRIVRGIQPTTDCHRLLVEGPAHLQGVWDEQRLTEVIENLLSNAIKFAPDGGDITIALAAPESNAVTLSVQDPGLGLTPAALKHIFERYYRAGRTRRTAGTGLGLYICEGIVTAHGGRIWAESPGRGWGSTFWVVLPRVTLSFDRGPVAEAAATASMKPPI